MLEILILLMNRKQVQAKDLATNFTVSVRTIYRDIETLSLAGIPIEMTRGRSGGIRLMHGFSLSRIPITTKEKDVLQVALQNLSTTNFPEVALLMEKFQALWDAVEKDWIVIDPAEYGAPPERNEIFAMMKQCILENRKVSFIYYNSNRQKTRREVAPLKLWYRGNAWYLWGYCYLRKAYRLFHVHRMVDAVITDYFPPSFEESVFEAFRQQAVTPAPKLAVHIVFEASVYYRLLAIFPAEILRIVSDRIEVKTEIPKTDWLYSFLLSFGSDVQIIAPESLRLEIRASLQKAVKNYE
nr:YafY family protein [Listeria portnoyi]